MRKRTNDPARERTGKRRFNSADVVIILLCVLGIAGMVFRFGFMEKIEKRSAQDKAVVSVLVENVSRSSVDYILPGHSIRYADSGDEFGTVSKVTSVTPSAVYVYTDDGKIEKKESVHDRVDIRIDILVEGENTEAGFMLDGTRYIAPNMSVGVKTALLSVSVLVTDIQIGE